MGSSPNFALYTNSWIFIYAVFMEIALNRRAKSQKKENWEVRGEKVPRLTWFSTFNISYCCLDWISHLYDHLLQKFLLVSLNDIFVCPVRLGTQWYSKDYVLTMFVNWWQGANNNTPFIWYFYWWCSFHISNYIFHQVHKACVILTLPMSINRSSKRWSGLSKFINLVNRI